MLSVVLPRRCLCQKGLFQRRLRRLRGLRVHSYRRLLIEDLRRGGGRELHLLRVHAHRDLLEQGLLGVGEHRDLQELHRVHVLPPDHGELQHH